MNGSEAGGSRAASASKLPRIVASLFYGLGARAHRKGATWLRGSRGRPGCKVLSVGGLTVGGAGKTPVAAALARALHLRGRRVVLASRGYRGQSRDRVRVVSDGRNIRSAATKDSEHMQN